PPETSRHPTLRSAWRATDCCSWKKAAHSRNRMQPPIRPTCNTRRQSIDEHLGSAFFNNKPNGENGVRPQFTATPSDPLVPTRSLPSRSRVKKSVVETDRAQLDMLAAATLGASTPSGAARSRKRKIA